MKILNIGSGPVTLSGNAPGLELRHADRRDYGIPVEIRDMEKLAYPDKEFDLVVCVNALDHTPNARAAIKEFVRVGRWVYIDCALIQRTTSGKNHYWDALEGGIFQSKDDEFNIRDYGFEVEFIYNGPERRYNHVICRYTE